MSEALIEPLTGLARASGASLNADSSGNATGSFAPVDSSDREAFVEAMRRAVTGVNIVTTDGSAGRFGLTVSAFSSVSAMPPLVLVCINRRSPASAAVRENGSFCVNLLSTDQRNLAETFAGQPRVAAPYDFTVTQWETLTTGAPYLPGAVANFDCFVETTISAGTHDVFLGRVADVKQRAGRPLLYTDRAYGSPLTGIQKN